MGVEKGLIIGIDICDDFTQITYLDSEVSLPKSISRDGKEEYLIPTKLAFDVKTHKWLVGNDPRFQGAVIIEVVDFFKNIRDEVIIQGEEYVKNYLVEIYIQQLLKMVSGGPIKKIGITFPSLNREIIDLMKAVMKKIDIDYILMDHDEAFFHYAVNQKREMWINDVALFEVGDEFTVKLLSVNTREDPAIATISYKNSPNLNIKMIKDNVSESEVIFNNLASMELSGKIISTIYAVGRGFADDWADDILKKLSPGKRVFKGQNLYASGACLSAQSLTSDKIFLGKDNISVGISIKALEDGREKELLIFSPSTHWYEAETSLELLVKGESELGIRFKDYSTKKTERRFISLSGVDIKENSITRIRLSLKFTSCDRCIIKATDLGFGSFTPTTNRVWELIWER